MPITIDKIDDGLPISIIVPLSRNRRIFFYNMVLPLLEANNVNEIIVNDNDGNAPKKRNEGFKKSTQPFVIFVDDDILMPSNYISSFYDVLLKNPDIAFAYSGYHGIVIYPESHPMHGNFQIPNIEFNKEALKRGNYISTMSLMRREVFPTFDENLKRLQDWSLFLTIVENGGKGILVPTVTFYAYYLDSGITSNNNNEFDAIMAIKKKHGI